MSRYVNRIPLGNADVSMITARVGEFMTAEGFKEIPYKGGLAWKKGAGIMMGPQSLVVSYTQTDVTVEAFIKYALFPGVFIGEMSMNSFWVGAIPRGLLQSRVTKIEQYLYSLLAQQVPSPMPQA